MMKKPCDAEREAEYANEDSQSDRDKTIRAVRKDGNALQHATDAHRADPEIVKAAVSQNGLALRFATGGLKQEVELLKAAGFLDAGNFLSERPEKAILSLDCSLAETSTGYAAAFVLEMRRDGFLRQFKAYQPDLWCEPDHGLSSRSQMEKSKATNGFMIQIEEMQGLGDRQKLEKDIAKDIGLKVFHVKTCTLATQHKVDWELLCNRDIVSVSKAVDEWYSSGCATDCVQDIDLSTDNN